MFVCLFLMFCLLCMVIGLWAIEALIVFWIASFVIWAFALDCTVTFAQAFAVLLVIKAIKNLIRSLFFERS